MRPADRVRRCRYVLQPWRYETEYARAWCEIDFPIYGLAVDVVRAQCMGPKGRAGRVPDGVWRRLPSVLWMQMTHLGVIESTSSWRVTIDSRIGQLVPPVEYLEQRLRHHPPRGDRPERVRVGAELESRSVDVGGRPVRFDGVGLGSMWLGVGRIADVVVEVLTEGLPAELLALCEITDPAPYLKRRG